MTWNEDGNPIKINKSLSALYLEFFETEFNNDGPFNISDMTEWNVFGAIRLQMRNTPSAQKIISAFHKFRTNKTSRDDLRNRTLRMLPYFLQRLYLAEENVKNGTRQFLRQRKRRKRTMTSKNQLARCSHGDFCHASIG